MSEKRSLGRGLDDLIHEVSAVKAMPVQPAAEVPAQTPPPAADAPAMVPPAATEPLPSPAPEAPVAQVEPAAEAAAPVIVEERPADAVINANAKPRVEREIVRQAYVPVWAWIMIASGAVAAVVLGVLMNKTVGHLAQSREETRVLRAELNRDKLAWIDSVKGRGFTIERRNEDARIVFDAPLFSTDARTTPFAEEALGSLIVPLSGHAREIRLVIVGHTSPTPTRAGQPSSHDLGLRRAESIRRLLVDVAGWPAGGVSIRSAGDKDPPYRGADPLSQARNRTVTIEVSAR